MIQIRKTELDDQKNKFKYLNTDFTNLSQAKGGISVAIKMPNTQDRTRAYSPLKPLSAYSTNWSKSAKQSTGGRSKESLGDAKNSARQVLAHENPRNNNSTATDTLCPPQNQNLPRSKSKDISGRPEIPEQPGKTSQRSDHSKKSDVNFTSGQESNGTVMQMPTSYQRYKQQNTKPNNANQVKAKLDSEGCINGQLPPTNRTKSPPNPGTNKNTKPSTGGWMQRLRNKIL